MSAEKEEKSYICKSVDIIIFLLHLKFYQNLKNCHAEKLNKTDLVNICFSYPSRTMYSGR